MKSLLLALLTTGLLASVLLLPTPIFADEARATASGNLHAYFGTYTDGASKGLYHAVFDRATGKLSEPQLVAKLVNPSWNFWW